MDFIFDFYRKKYIVLLRDIITIYCYSEPMLPNSILKQGLVPKQKEDSTTKKQKGIKNFAREGHIFLN